MTFRAFIENEAGSNRKSHHNEKTLTFQRSETVSRAYPYPYGFIIGTANADGDCLDCFVITNRALRTGEMVECEAVGLMEQTEDGLSDHNVLARLVGEQATVTADVRASLVDFVQNVFSHIPGKRIGVGKFLGTTEADDQICHCWVKHDVVETFDEKVARVLAEEIQIVPYDPRWPDRFEEEKSRLLAMLPNELIRRIEHFGSTAVPGLAAKPLVDMLVEVTDLEETRARIVPVLEARGYDFFWRGANKEDVPPFYAWFIARDASTGQRTHHIHMVEPDSPHWERLLFRDYLIDHPEAAKEYDDLKLNLAATFRHDREGYTAGKGEFIGLITERAKQLHRSSASATRKRTR